MRLCKHLLVGVGAAALVAAAAPASAADPIGKGLIMYMQMGGNPGDGATLARQTGAAQAAEALGVDLKAQFSAWAPETMIAQFKEAMAAKPTCIEIMGHPGATAFHDLVKQATDQGIVVTDGNSPMTALQNEFGTKGFGYAGVDLYAGGALTANAMLAKGLKSGDEAMVYGVFSQAERGQSEKGLADTLEKAGLKVDRLEITQEVNSDTSLGVPILAAYVQAHPNLKAIGTQHGGVTGILQRGAARRPARSRATSSSAASTSRRRPSTGLKSRLRHRDARPAALSAGLHAGRAMRDDRQVQDAGPVAQHRRRRRHARHDRRAHPVDRRRHSLISTSETADAARRPRERKVSTCRKIPTSRVPTAMSARRTAVAAGAACLLPPISLGLWQNFGGLDSFETGRAILRRAFDRGVTHFDLANNYGPPPGAAEEVFGRLLATDFRPYRDEIIVSSKAGYRMWPGPYGEWGSRKNLLASLDASLKRLGLDYVDIFYHHRPDPETPIEETMSALADAVRQGKALYVGISNYRAAQAREAFAALRGLGVRCLIHQPRYSMLDRWVERDGLLDALAEEGVGCIVFSPLAQGVLTDKYLDGIPEDSRAQRGSRGGSMGREGVTDERIAIVRRLRPIAKRLGLPIAHLALKWVLRDERVTSAVVGARTLAQIDDSLDAVSGPALAPSDLDEIEKALNAS